MLSIIVCSVRPQMLAALKENIYATIGSNVDYEIIDFDNRKDKYSIAKVYNLCASQAKYPYLLFIHEDACFLKKDWFGKICGKLSEPGCGVIGFAGSKAKTCVPSSWCSLRKLNVTNYYYKSDKGESNHSWSGMTKDKEFEEVVVLDGFALFVRKDVWEEYPFDESVIRGFHCYDFDFTLTISKRYRNYVCGTIDIKHFSNGNFDGRWFADTLYAFNKKWHRMLPATSSDLKLSRDEMKELEEKEYFRLLRNYRKLRKYNSWRHFGKFLKYPLTPKHLGHIMKFMVLPNSRVSGIIRRR